MTTNNRSFPRDVRVTHPDKVWFPKAKLTKGDVFNFYESISPWLLSHLKDRPITVERLPDGLAKPNAPRFWQKNTPDYYPDWIKRVELRTEDGRVVRYSLINDLPALLYFVNQGAITFHTYFSRVGSLDKPDFVIFDLDPGGAKFSSVVTIAKAIRDLLKQEGAEAFPKTSGKSGLHVLTPWDHTRGGYDVARAWALQIATRVTEQLPRLATIERSIAKRRGRVYVDVMQNALGRHVVPPYVLRAVPEATVSTPLEWREVTARLNPKKFTTDAVLARLKRRKIDPLRRLIESG
jgi:bifunctional non-homologous end joining protein LigD